MSKPDDTDTGSTFSPVGSLRPDGTLEGGAGSSAPPQPGEIGDAALELARPLRHPRSLAAAPESYVQELPPAFESAESLELVPHVRHSDRVQTPSAFLTPPPPETSRRRPRVPLKLLVLLLAVGLGYGAWQWFERGGTVEGLMDEARALGSDTRALTRSAKHAVGFTQGTVLLLSTPDGATVTIDGEEIGVTPFAGDLRWKKGAEITFTRRGYGTWTGTLPAGPEVKLDVTLRRAPNR